MTTDDVRTYVDKCAGRLRLDRPKALHSLNLAMVRAMMRALLDWRHDPDVRIVLIDHAEGRGFCAGGDVVTIAKDVPQGATAGHEFFFHEYRLNHLMYTYPKPGVAFMDGVTMGGGVGIACPCRYRVATERTLFAMPETTIGLFPDVGGGRYLSRLRGRSAQYLALTGARLDGADCVAMGLANFYVPSDALDDVKAQICATPEKTESILAGAAIPPPPAKIVGQLPDIDRLFASDDYETILRDLEADGGEWATAQLATLAQRSPTSCKVSLKMLVESPRHLHFVDEMRMEFAIMVRMYQAPDFAEGVRALLIDKTGDPRWTPPTPSQVTDAMVDAYFQPLPADRAWTPLPAKE
ncbi:MAG: enoyl-CoA hydratase/isomerase family protein [Sphingomonas sp.]|uniref:enoyl-CoA hydratase/isomerase family protein n=1 Tax=Sphingomonas sp. TaxID=28214 RepID=UPI001AC7699B|nr:enoyl-CoA hydratase/isomerase family protein [Sphingomonas sp.]MBN8808692.1 enoyl-CoA hydratase/isomerase family protein [Sphingomonas sp.]